MWPLHQKLWYLLTETQFWKGRRNWWCEKVDVWSSRIQLQFSPMIDVRIQRLLLRLFVTSPRSLQPYRGRLRLPLLARLTRQLSFQFFARRFLRRLFPLHCPRKCHWLLLLTCSHAAKWLWLMRAVKNASPGQILAHGLPMLFRALAPQFKQRLLHSRIPRTPLLMVLAWTSLPRLLHRKYLWKLPPMATPCSCA